MFDVTTDLSKHPGRLLLQLWRKVIAIPPPRSIFPSFFALQPCAHMATPAPRLTAACTASCLLACRRHLLMTLYESRTLASAAAVEESVAAASSDDRLE